MEHGAAIGSIHAVLGGHGGTPETKKYFFLSGLPTIIFSRLCLPAPLCREEAYLSAGLQEIGQRHPLFLDLLLFFHPSVL